MWIGQPICAEAKMRPRKVTLAGDDIGNFATLLSDESSWTPRFLRSTTHKQVVGKD